MSKLNFSKCIQASLWVDRKVEVPKPPPLLRVYNKPKWMLSVMKDSKGRNNVGDLDFISKMHPVGRLDYDSSGLLLFSSDGSLTQQLLHPSHEIEKEYVALVVGKADEDKLREKLAAGVTTSLGAFPAKLVEAKPIPNDQVRHLITEIIKNLPEEYDLDRLEEKGYLFFKGASELSQIRLVVQEGKNTKNMMTCHQTHFLLLNMIKMVSYFFRQTSHGSKDSS
jgi:pseudouridine synthase